MPAPRSRSAPLERSNTWTSQPSRLSAIDAAHPAMLPPMIPTVLPRIRVMCCLRARMHCVPSRAPECFKPDVAASYGITRKDERAGCRLRGEIAPDSVGELLGDSDDGAVEVGAGTAREDRGVGDA